MQDFLKKYKKILIIILILLLLVGSFVLIYFFLLKDSNILNNKSTNEISNVVDDPKELTPRPDFDERSSREAILATNTEAKKWSSDSKLYSCTGMTSSSFEYPDVTYYFLGAEEGKYAKWLCTYYSKSKGETVLVEYDEGVLESDTPFEIGEYGYLTYDSIDYPSDLEGIVDSTLIYDYAVEKGLDIDKNYVNMYLANTQDYGFVWKVDERDMEEEDEYGTGILVNSYIFKTSGEFVTISR